MEGKVILRPLGRNKWANVVHYAKCYTWLAPYWTRSGSVYTGLAPQYVAPEIKERLEQALGQDLNVKLEGDLLKGFWGNYFIKVGSRDISIDLSTPRGELDYYFLKNHKRVAQSINDIKPGNDFVLIDETADARVISEYNSLKRKAAKEYDKMSISDKRRALRLYGNPSENVSDEIVDAKLYEYVEKDPDRFFKVWADNKNRDIEHMISQAITYNIINRSKNIYRYGQDIIGHSLEDTIVFLENPLNQDIKLAIMKQLNLK